MNPYGKTTQDQLTDFFEYLQEYYDNKYLTELNNQEKDLYL